MGGSRWTVVPPAPIPETLEERCGVAGEELNVGAQRLGDEPQVTAGRMVGGQPLDHSGEIRHQVEDIPRLGLGLEPAQVQQQIGPFLPATRPGQVVKVMPSSA